MYCKSTGLFEASMTRISLNHHNTDEKRDKRVYVVGREAAPVPNCSLRRSMIPVLIAGGV